ncbi:putative spermidine/putrescine transport system permease protein [Rhodoligotrophos appendicifer]|uniref:ABC transporter permease n=1 Tax=Rhodoligotrophos appendicifer TaxID=987056 RepID=UPI001186BEBB|nr:ABC transporter permease [Rhodoligotrophos appendicifer]
MTSSRKLDHAVTLVVILAMVMMILPNVIILPASFGGEDYIIFPPRSFSTKWYHTFFETPAWQSATVNSLIVAVCSMIAATIVGTLAALGMVRLSQRSRGLMMSFFLLPTIVPTIITGVALYGLLARTGLRGGVFGIVLGHTIIATPFVIINVVAALQRMDMRLEHGARSLGASPLKAFYYVTLPIIWPGIAAGAAFAFLTSFSELVLALFLTSGATTTLPVQMWSGIRFEINPTVAAASTLFVVVSCVMLLVVGLLRRKGERTA